MAPGPIHLSTTSPSRPPPTASYTPLSPYTDTHQSPTLLTNNLLFPENDHSLTNHPPRRSSLASPPSPTTSIQSFDILDAIAWRTSYYDTYPNPSSSRRRRCRRTCTEGLRTRGWRKSRAHIIALAMVLLVLVVGCVVGTWAAVRWDGRRGVREACVRREGGLERCWKDWEWARCVGENGVGFCEGVVGEAGR
ncbi:hypothetical protein DM02DRAFT_733425 [Periconia macrospinosa]|uniref:Uncharacterized protein n=1 Tax=Periconia macrospinosa TaxID=97972 RepID=A0A2V1D6Q8_9PLEO|nr:hypothetical protein DM02DRAFT_733425 [Periconia macrospinosa]